MSATVVSGGLIRTTGFIPSGGATLLPLLEPWTVPDALATLNGNLSWTAFIGTNGWDVVDGAAQLEDAGSIAHGGRVNADLGTDDHQATLTFEEFAPDVIGLLSAGPCVRMQGTSAQTFYRAVVVSTGGGSPVAILAQVLAGVVTTLGSAVPVTAHAGMTLRLRALGSSLRVFVDGGLVINETDTAIPTGRFAGLQGVATGLNRVRVDNWIAAAPSVATTVASRRSTFASGGRVGSRSH